MHGGMGGLVGKGPCQPTVAGGGVRQSPRVWPSVMQWWCVWMGEDPHRLTVAESDREERFGVERGDPVTQREWRGDCHSCQGFDPAACPGENFHGAHLPRCNNGHLTDDAILVGRDGQGDDRNSVVPEQP